MSWLPLYHDMGLIGSWLGSLYFGIPLVLMSPLVFLSRPERWLWAIHTHRGTLSASPNFGFELCLSKIKDRDIEGLDLSSWRIALNGAEVVYPSTLERFYARFKDYGLRQETLRPVYGLAESTVGLTIPPLTGKSKVDLIDRVRLEEKGEAVPCKDKKKGMKVVSCGKPIPKHEVKIVNEMGDTVLDRQVGMLWFRGPSNMQGYYRNPSATQEISHDGWLDSTDFAYKAEGEIYIVGRKKDVIIKAGRNLYPQDIEEVTNAVPGVRKGCCCAFSAYNSLRVTEEIILVVETREKQQNKRDEISRNIVARMSDFLGFSPDHIIFVEPGTVPKTSSGKLQRSACKTSYIKNELGHKRAPVWYQFLKVFLQSYLRKTRNGFVVFVNFLYTIYALLLFVGMTVPCLLTLILTPKKIAQKVVRLWAKFFFLCTGMLWKIKGEDQLKKKKSMIYVANHASYLDGILLTGILPPGVLIVGKQELTVFPPLRWLLKKLGHLTVSRLDFSKSLSDLDTIDAAIRMGKSILIFPEGTFTSASGLRPFKLGAFKLAVDCQVPVCPISIRGTRKILSDHSYLISPHKIGVTIMKIVTPKHKDWKEVVQLREIIREDIAKNIDEPMLRSILPDVPLGSDNIDTD